MWHLRRLGKTRHGSGFSSFLKDNGLIDPNVDERRTCPAGSGRSYKRLSKIFQKKRLEGDFEKRVQDSYGPALKSIDFDNHSQIKNVFFEKPHFLQECFIMISI
ncbi:MAG: hypothetical protein NT172_17040 [Planctomycetota bacterium]|nr:hypothetical protein [Planctomycetota bacterium]